MNLFHKVSMLLAGLLLAGGGALAQSGKPVNLMVPYPAGGPSDSIARIFNVPLGRELGEQVLVETWVALAARSPRRRCWRRLPMATTFSRARRTR